MEERIQASRRMRKEVYRTQLFRQAQGGVGHSRKPIGNPKIEGDVDVTAHRCYPFYRRLET